MTRKHTLPAVVHRSASGPNSPVAAVASALCACVAILVAPWRAAAALVPLSESHRLSAHSTIDAVTRDQAVPGSTPRPAGPIAAEARALDAAARLNLTFDGRSIAGRLTGVS